jgi:hypothetical protein
MMDPSLHRRFSFTLTAEGDSWEAAERAATELLAAFPTQLEQRGKLPGGLREFRHSIDRPDHHGSVQVIENPTMDGESYREIAKQLR